MHLSGCIFIVGMALLGAVFSVRIKGRVATVANMCLEGYGVSKVRIARCEDNSTSQNWIVDGDHIKNQVQQQCLADRLVPKLLVCEFTPTNDKNFNKEVINSMKIRIEGNEVKNYRNNCMYFESSKPSFKRCDGDHLLLLCKAYPVYENMLS
jgi:hypothetical protein